MPTYEYRCTECGRELDVVQKFSDASLTVCPTCSGALRKVFNAVGVVFKGSGFYRTDSRSGSKSEVMADSSDKKSEKVSSETNGETKTTKAQPKTEPKGDKVPAGSSGSSSSTGAKAASS